MTPVRLLEERRFDPPRAVDVKHNGSWWPATQSAWRLCDDDRGWMADVTWAERHDWGPGKYLTMVPAERVRATAEPHSQPDAFVRFGLYISAP